MPRIPCVIRPRLRMRLGIEAVTDPLAQACEAGRLRDETHRRRAGPLRRRGSAWRGRRRRRPAGAPARPARPASAAAPPRSGRRPNRRSRRRSEPRASAWPSAPPEAGGQTIRHTGHDAERAAGGKRLDVADRSSTPPRRPSSCSISAAPNGASALPSEAARSATEAAMPSSRSRVIACPLTAEVASAPTSKPKRRARQMRRAGDIEGRAQRRRHRLVRGDVIKPGAASACARFQASASPSSVTSVITASVPHDPASSLQRS